MTIRRLLILQGVGSATLALLLTCAGFVALESLEARRVALQEATLLGEIVGSHASGALAFYDEAVAHETLASLASNPRVRIACLYDAAGELFAKGPRGGGDAAVRCPPQGADEASFRDGRVRLRRSIGVGDEKVGSLYLESEIESLGTRIARRARVGLPVLAGAVLVALLFAVWIQRRVTGPIHALVARTRALARGELSEGDAPDVGGSDVREIAVLAGAFRDMGSDLRTLVTRTRDGTAAVAETVAILRESSARIAADGRAQREAVAKSMASVEAIGSSVEAVSSSADELAGISKETSTSLATIDASIAEVGGHAEELSAAVDLTAGSVAELIAGTKSTGEDLSHLRESAGATVGSVASLRSSLDAVREGAGESDRLAAATAQEALRGREVVDGTASEMRAIREGFVEIEEVVGEVAAKSEDVGELVNLISDIADETGMLALNAAIIAAQAGDRGRAFSVVAEQVRTLSDRTSMSLGEITALVRGMQSSTTRAVTLVASGTRRVQLGVKRSEEAGLALGEIGDSASQAAAIASRIAKATESQATDLERVRHDAERAQGIAEQIASTTEQQRRTSSGIGQTTDHAGQLVKELDRLCTIQREGSRHVDGLGQRIAAIASASRSQRDQRKQLDVALQIFREASEKSASHAEEMEAIIERLAERSEYLESAMSRFRL